MAGEPNGVKARARRILYALISEYIATGEPVGSRRLAARYGIDVSPATIRSELAALEQAGLVRQPHASAGRVPTDQGFRVFVDALMQLRELAEEDRQLIADRIDSLSDGESSLREAGRLLSALTGHAAVVSLPKSKDEVLLHVRLVPIDEHKILVVLVTQNGQVQNRVVKRAQRVSASELERMSNYLETNVAGRTLPEARDHFAREAEAEREDYQQLRHYSLAMLDAALAGHKGPASLVIEGQTRLFDRPEFSDGERIKQFLRTFEDRQQLLDVLDRTLLAGGVQVLIGAETKLAQIEDISLVSATYDSDGEAVGALAVVGLTRMDYARIVPLVEFTAQRLGASLKKESE